MTEENTKANVAISLEKASKMLAEAELLFSHDMVTGAVSRLYYFLLHTIGALLLTRGLDPKTHEDVLRVFGLYFIKGGIFEPKASHLFARLMKYREEADYNPSYVFTREDFLEFKGEAEDLARKIRDYVREKRYL